MKEESRVEREKRLKREKPYLFCKWYPYECNAVGCDASNEWGCTGPCRDYIEEEEWND